MRWNLKELTDISGKEHRKIKKMLHFLIEKYTRYGIIYLQSVDTKSAVKDTVIPSFSWEIGAKTDCNKTRRS